MDVRRVPSLAVLAVSYAVVSVARVVVGVVALATGMWSAPEDKKPARFSPDRCRVWVYGPWIRPSGWAPVDAGERRRECFLFLDGRGDVRVGRSSGWIGPEVTVLDRVVRGPWTVLSCRLESVDEMVLLVARGDDYLRWADRVGVHPPGR
jgi:hypothetical protein